MSGREKWEMSKAEHDRMLYEWNGDTSDPNVVGIPGQVDAPLTAEEQAYLSQEKPF